MIKRGILRVWSQVLAASIITTKQPVATAERYAPITPYPAATNAFSARFAHVCFMPVYVPFCR